MVAILKQPLTLFSENVLLMIRFYRILISLVKWFMRLFANTTDNKQTHTQATTISPTFHNGGR